MREIFILAVNFLFGVYYFLILVQAFVPWFPGAAGYSIVKLVNALTDPLLKIIRKGLPPNQLGIDASPFVAIIFIWLLQKFVLMLIA